MQRLGGAAGYVYWRQGLTCSKHDSYDDCHNKFMMVVMIAMMVVMIAVMVVMIAMMVVQ